MICPECDEIMESYTGPRLLEFDIPFTEWSVQILLFGTRVDWYCPTCAGSHDQELIDHASMAAYDEGYEEGYDAGSRDGGRW